MEPWEIMISESQERMVAVVRPEMLDAVQDVCDALGAAVHGDRRGDRLGRAARLPRRTRSSARSRRGFLTDECPRYEVEQRAEPRPCGGVRAVGRSTSAR